MESKEGKSEGWADPEQHIDELEQSLAEIEGQLTEGRELLAELEEALRDVIEYCQFVEEAGPEGTEPPVALVEENRMRIEIQQDDLKKLTRLRDEFRVLIGTIRHLDDELRAALTEYKPSN